jgi:uracil-DNA glycosylase
MDSTQVGFLRSVQSLLRYHQTIGVSEYQICADITSFLSIRNIQVDTVLEEKTRPEVAASSFRECTTGTIGDISDEVCSCTSCSLHKNRLQPVPGHGGERPRLVLIGGWLIGEEGMETMTGSVFGQEEDIMVSRMLSAISLSAEEAYITNVIKCALPRTCQPTAAHIHTCLSFIQRQILALAPEIICTMGIVATKALLKSTQPLSKIRGRLHQFAITDQKTIPVIPTYHPTFLLRNPELKRATWGDLQSIAKQLKTEKSEK